MSKRFLFSLKIDYVSFKDSNVEVTDTNRRNTSKYIFPIVRLIILPFAFSLVVTEQNSNETIENLAHIQRKF